MFLLSCNLLSIEEKDGDREINMRIALESVKNEGNHVRVFLEGKDGNFLTGSTVIIVNSQGVVNLLGFSFEKGCYIGEIPFSVDGIYKIMVDSVLMRNTLVQEINHYILLEDSEIQVLQNPQDLSALEGETLDIAKGLQIGWSSVEHATVYQIMLYYEGNLCYLGTASSTSLTLEPEQLKGSGLYTCQIVAQYISGDALMLQENFYSFSQTSGSSVNFYMESY